MKKAFSQNGRRNIAVVVDLLSLSPSLCAITTPVEAAEAGLPAAGNRRPRSGESALFCGPLNEDAQYFILDFGKVCVKWKRIVESRCHFNANKHYFCQICVILSQSLFLLKMLLKWNGGIPGTI